MPVELAKNNVNTLLPQEFVEVLNMIKEREKNEEIK